MTGLENTSNGKDEVRSPSGNTECRSPGRRQGEAQWPSPTAYTSRYQLHVGVSVRGKPSSQSRTTRRSRAFACILAKAERVEGCGRSRRRGSSSAHWVPMVTCRVSSERIHGPSLVLGERTFALHSTSIPAAILHAISGRGLWMNVGRGEKCRAHSLPSRRPIYLLADPFPLRLPVPRVREESFSIPLVTGASKSAPYRARLGNDHSGRLDPRAS